MSDGFVQLSLFNLLAQKRGQIQSVLDQTSIKINDIEAAVRAVDHIDWTKPLVGRRQELGLIVSVTRRNDAVLLDDFVSPHKIGSRLTNKPISQEILREIRSSIN